MKKIFIPVLILILSCILLISCNFNKNDTNINETNLDDLMEFKDSYVGDNSAVSGILNNLPGNQFRHPIELKTEKVPYAIEITYKLDQNSNLKMEDLDKYWNSNNIKKLLLNNVTTLFILVKNVDNIKITIEKSKEQIFNFSRKNLEKFYGKDLREYSNDKSLWNKEILNGKLQSPKEIDRFFTENKPQ